mmetsp:Transcript_86887/g.280698  ORF Transcript_86887/g.280698 Transcript_86887/m.280698 type:complete len:374 (+) Transcript_86887:57-1178(+)
MMSLGSPRNMMSLRLRSTFLEVQNAEEEIELMLCRRPRSLSQPCLNVLRTHGSTGLSQAQVYINNLSDKLAALDGDARIASLFFDTTVQSLDLCAESGGGSSTTGEVFSRACFRDLNSDEVSDATETSDMHLMQSATTNAGQNLSNAQKLLMAAAMEDALNASVVDTLLRVKADTPTADSSGLDLAASSFSCASASKGLEEAAVAVPPSDGSRGSAGHPQLCNRACLYFATGACTSGSDCHFCHMEHTKRGVHLDRHHREMLRVMPPQEWAALVLPILKQRLQSVDDSPESQGMLSDILARCGIPDAPMSSAMPQRSQRMFALNLRSMSLKAMLAVVRYSLMQHDRLVEEKIDKFVQHLRRLSCKGVQLSPAP